MKTIKSNLEKLHTPCYIIDEDVLRKNGEILQQVSQNTGCKILLAQKAFSNFNFYPILSEYLAGTEASGLYEARLGKEEMPQKECHVFCGAYREEEFEELLSYADHIVFNSIYQLKQYGKRAKEAGKSLGLRINPECSTQEGHEIYDPCSSVSRLGVTRAVWEKEMTEELLSLLSGIHFHTLCEQNSDDFETTMYAVEEKFGDILPKMEWINIGGGHHITREDYDLARLEKCIKHLMQTYDVDLYIEPGEAVALNAGYLVTQVLDIVENGKNQIAILDMSAACHTPDVIEMPYLPPLFDSYEAKANTYDYWLGGPTCLAGDMVGEYSFDHELARGEYLVFGDMAIYSMCKTNTFNGMPLPTIYGKSKETIYEVVSFGYEDFKMRLGKKS